MSGISPSRPAREGAEYASIPEEPQRRRSTLLTGEAARRACGGVAGQAGMARGRGGGGWRGCWVICGVGGVCPFILGNEFCERLAFYGLSTNLVIYLTRVMGEDNGMAAMQVNLFEGTCYLTPLLGAWLADSLWGRYKTILVFSAIYLLNAALFGSLYIVALGTGGIKPNVAAFGADQFDEADPQDRKEKTSFFNWFYFFVNIGSLLAVTVIVWIQENVSWAVGFAVPAACMLVAMLMFVAWVAWRARRAAEPASAAEASLLSDGAGLLSAGGGGYQSVLDGRGFAPVAPLVADGGGGGGGMRRTASLPWLDCAAEVEEVKLVFRMLPVFCATIFYSTIYVQAAGLLGGKRHGDLTGCVADMTIWWQAPQYLLIGLSEVFTSIGQLEFFYDQAPDVMRSCSIALVLLSVAAGSYLSGAVVLAVSAWTRAADPAGLGWLPKDLNRGRLDLFFLLLGALMAANLLCYLWVAMRYEYKAVEHRPAGRPPRPRPVTQPVASLAASRAHPRAAAAAAALPPESPAPTMFSRSITFRLGARLEDFEATPLYQPAGASAAAASASLHEWLARARSEVPAAAEVPWAALYAAAQHASAHDGWAASALPWQQLLRALAHVASAAARQAEQAGAAGAGGGAADDGVDPRHRLALQNAFKLALFFTCHIVKAVTAAAEAAAGQGAANKGRGSAAGGTRGVAASAADRASQLLQLCGEGLRGLVTMNALLWGGAALSAAPDVRAADQLLRSAALGCLLAPSLAQERGARAPNDGGLRRSCTAIVSRPLVQADKGGPHGAALQTLHDIQAAVCGAKPPPQVLAACAELLEHTMVQSSAAGASAVAWVVDHAVCLATPARGAVDASRQQQLESWLGFAGALASGGGAATRGALLLSLGQLIPLGCQGRAGVRRALLDLLSRLAAAPHPASGAAGGGGGGGGGSASAGSAVQACQAACLDAMIHLLRDKDANLRAKALGCLDSHAALLAGLLAPAAPPGAGPAVPAGGEARGAAAEPGTAAGEPGTAAAGAAALPDARLDALLTSLCARLRDRSSSVRKRARLLLRTLVAAALAPGARRCLADAVLPLASQLLAARPDSALHLGEAAAELCAVALALAEASSAAAGLACLLSMGWVVGAEEPARAQLDTALLGKLLPAAGTAEALVAHLARALGPCSIAEASRLRAVVGAAAVSPGGTASRGRAALQATAAAAAVVQLCWTELAARVLAGQQGPQEGQEEGREGEEEGGQEHSASPDAASLAKVLFVVGPFSSPAAAPSEAALLLSVLARLASPDGLPAPAGGERIGRAAGLWLLRTLAAALPQLTPAREPGADAPEQQQPWLQPAVLGAAHAMLAWEHGNAPLRRAALQAVLALPEAQAAAQALLQELLSSAGGAALPDQGLPAALELDPETGQLLRAAQGGRAPQGADSAAGAAADAPAGGRKRRLRCLLAAVELMGEMATCYEAQRAAFLRELQARARVEAAAAAAMRALGRLAVLSQPLYTQHMGVVERCLWGGERGDKRSTGEQARVRNPPCATAAAAEVQAAAVAVLADAIDAFPSAFGSRVALLGELMAVAPAADEREDGSAAPPAAEAAVAAAAAAGQLRRHAAAAYARLLLADKLKVESMLGAVGAVLAAGSVGAGGRSGRGDGKSGAGGGADPVAALMLHTARRLLDAARSPKDRARLAIGLFQRTPAHLRGAVLLRDVLTPADLRSDLLVGQAVQAFVAAEGGAAARAAAALLAGCQPSAKVLGALRSHLLGGGGGGGANKALTHAGVAEHLRAFVGNHVPSAPAAGEGDGASAGGGKRKRAGGGDGKGASAALQQQLLDLLGGGGGGQGAGRRRGTGPQASTAQTATAPARTPQAGRAASVAATAPGAGGSSQRRGPAPSASAASAGGGGEGSV
eukprot:scaffold14.g1044.t1